MGHVGDVTDAVAQPRRRGCLRDAPLLFLTHTFKYRSVIPLKPRPTVRVENLSPALLTPGGRGAPESPPTDPKRDICPPHL